MASAATAFKLLPSCQLDVRSLSLKLVLRFTSQLLEAESTHTRQPDGAVLELTDQLVLVSYTRITKQQSQQQTIAKRLHE